MTPNLKIASGVIGALFVIIGMISSYRVSRKLEKSRLITFKNPDGEVTVAISAIENYVRRVAKNVPGINDIKSNVRVNKKGIFITSSVSITAGTNIPEVTERIQMTVREKIQDMIGVEETINLKMHVTKITRGDESQQEDEKEEKGIPNIPFRNYE